MSEGFYSYESRRGIRPVSWEDFVGISKGLARAVASYEPDIILGIARGGLYAATFLSHLLQAELYPIRLTSRYKDRVMYDEPRWLVKPPPEVKDQKVLIVDEISSTGKTLKMAKQEVLALGAKGVRAAVMYAHSAGKDAADYIGFISDELLLNPWDREILQNGEFVLHPEYVHALQQQDLPPDPTLLIAVAPYQLAKEPK